MAIVHLKDLTGFVCAPETPIREVLARFNDLLQPCHVVLDQTGRLLGTVTDGDIRRALLKGVALDDSISQCMHTDGVTGRVGNHMENMSRLRYVEFLPLVDESGVVAELLIRKRARCGIDTCLVMAGGLGTRLGEKTHSLPKPLLPVGGKPILEQIIARLEAAGVSEIFISVHYLADKIEAFIAARENRATVRVIYEDSRLGTAGAISNLPQPLDSPLLIVNGDVVTDVDFLALQEFHQRSGCAGTVAVARYDVKVPFGVVWQDGDGLFASIEEKPTLRHFVAAGIYYLSPEFCALVSPNRPTDMPNLLNLGRKAGLRIGLFPIHEYWLDVGRPDDLEVVEREHGDTGRNAQTSGRRKAK